MPEKFLQLKQVSVPSPGTGPLLDQIDLTIGRGEQWALTGPSGSGKSALAHVLTGHLFYTGLVEFFGPKPRIVIVEQQHRFKNLYGTNDLYYQQRFNSYDELSTGQQRMALLGRRYRIASIDISGYCMALLPLAVRMSGEPFFIS